METRSLKSTDYGEWKVLYSGYKEFYGVKITETDLRTTFDWILDDDHPQYGFVLEDEGKLVGLANYQIHPNPLRASHRMYLNDLYVPEQHRNKGYGRIIIEKLISICKKNEFDCLRWMTAEDNIAARSLYDQYGTISSFVTYEVK
jgi:ribosomal protein S18 acetylase RimI-like enzyme